MNAFLDLLPRLERQARYQFRALDPERRAEATQEAVALARKAYRDATRQGNDLAEIANGIINFSIRRVGAGRRLGGRPGRDLLSRSAQQSHRFRVGSLSTPLPHGGCLADAIAAEAPPVPDQVADRLDCRAWRAALPDTDRAWADDLALELGTTEAAQRHGVSPARVSQKRRELARSWTLYRTDEPSVGLLRLDDSTPLPPFTLAPDPLRERHPAHAGLTDVIEAGLTEGRIQYRPGKFGTTEPRQQLSCGTQGDQTRTRSTSSFDTVGPPRVERCASRAAKPMPGRVMRSASN